MKQIFIFLVALFSCLNISAQTEHVKFMGIPLDGTINSFQQKLAGKGIKVDTELNKGMSVGVRVFKGVFCGYDSQIYIYYNPTTKVVYRGKACISDTNLSVINQRYEEIKGLLKNKYPENFCDELAGEFQNSFVISISDKEKTTGIGHAMLYISKFTEVYPPAYTLHIDYRDYSNDDKNNSDKQDDL